MLWIPLFIISFLIKGEHKMALLIAFKRSLYLKEKVDFLYFFCASANVLVLENESARSFPLSIALLRPSKELALMNPAASPRRKTPSLPVQKSFIARGLETRQASVLIGSPKEFSRNCSSLDLCSSKDLRQPCFLKAPPKIT